MGDVNKGIVLLTNKGNLPAENFKSIWKIIHIKIKNNVKIYPEPRNKTNLSSPDEKEIKDEEVVNADMDIEIRYKCLEVNAKDEIICLVIAYKYKCHDLKDYRRKELFYYWHVRKDKQAYWFLNNRDLGANENTDVDNMMLELRLKYFLQYSKL